MRDPVQWAVPAFQAFGVPVKLHVTLIVFIIGLFLRQVNAPGGAERPFEIFLLTVPMFFAVICLHELGHVLAGRLVDAEPREFVLWPLGGLVPIDTPREWAAHTVAAVGGSAMNLVFCAACAVLLASSGFLPNLNPVADPYTSETKNFRDGRVYTSAYGLRLYEANTATPAKPTEEMQSKLGKPGEVADAVTRSPYDRALAPTWAVYVHRFFWLSWVMFLLNLLPALPLDLGGVIQGVLWWRGSYTQSLATVSYMGYVVAVLLAIASMATNEVWPLGLGMMVAVLAMARMAALEMGDETGYGDFSQGYTSLGHDDPPPPRAKRQPFLKRWLSARAAKRMHRENEARQLEDDRMDHLLDKIARDGKASLTDEERRFMERVSARYRNR